jgi:hypothetical protein
MYELFNYCDTNGIDIVYCNTDSITIDKHYLYLFQHLIDSSMPGMLKIEEK